MCVILFELVEPFELRVFQVFGVCVEHANGNRARLHLRTELRHLSPSYLLLLLLQCNRLLALGPASISLLDSKTRMLAKTQSTSDLMQVNNNRSEAADSVVSIIDRPSAVGAIPAGYFLFPSVGRSDDGANADVGRSFID